MEHDARIASREPIDEIRNKARGQKGAAADPNLPGRRIGQKFDILRRLAQVVEHSRAASEQGATVLGWLDTLGVAVEQSHANGALQTCYRSGNGGLYRVEVRRSLVHAAGLHNRHEYVEVMQRDLTADPIAQLHRVLLSLNRDIYIPE